MLFVLSLLVACRPECTALETGGARDRCLYEQAEAALPTLTAVELGWVSAEIEDPIFRTTLILEWVRDHRGRADDADRDLVCGLLDGIERHHCVRDLMAAHLNR